MSISVLIYLGKSVVSLALAASANSADDDESLSFIRHLSV